MSKKESFDDFDGFVVKLNDRWRVIDSLEPYPYRQWILQYNSSVEKPNRWTTSPPYGSFCQHKKTLIRCIGEKVDKNLPDEVMSVINALPDRINVNPEQYLDTP
jgi:hypothetical protein